MQSPTPGPPTDSGARQALRRRLLADRMARAEGPQAAPAQAAFGGGLLGLIGELEPDLLGVYVPVRGEFNAIAPLEGLRGPKLHLALPFACREPPRMHYRAWRGEPLAKVDECGLPAPGPGPEVVPDVVLVPCVGFTRSGYRLGYGGGYFDRWLALHPGVTAVGVAWSQDEIDEADFAAQAHDRPLALILSELGVVG